MAEIAEGWQAASTEPGTLASPERLDALDWLPALIPGTAAAALRRAGEPLLGLDERDWWFRVRFDADAAAEGEEVVLRFGGIATAAEAYLNGRLLFTGASMFETHAIDV